MKKLVLILVFALACSVCFSEKVLVGLYIINLGKFDISDGSFSVDCYLSFKSETNGDIVRKINYEFMNGSADTTYEFDHDDNFVKLDRVKASLVVPVDLKEFPFEKHNIQIIVEDKELTKNKLEFVADKKGSGLDPSVFIPGYNIDSWDIKIDEHYYSVFDENYSKFIFTLRVSKPIWNAFQKTLLPVFFMVVMVLLSFLFKKEMVENRIAAITSGLLGVVMFHSSISGQLPPIGYLTFADKIMMISYLIIVASLIINVFLMKFMNNGKDRVAEMIDKRVKYNVFIVYIIVFAVYCMISIGK